MLVMVMVGRRMEAAPAPCRPSRGRSRTLLLLLLLLVVRQLHLDGAVVVVVFAVDDPGRVVHVAICRPHDLRARRVVGALTRLAAVLVGRDGGEAVGVVLVQLPRVLLEVEVAAESLLTDLARERLLLVVRVHVEGQVVDLQRFVSLR